MERHGSFARALPRRAPENKDAERLPITVNALAIDLPAFALQSQIDAPVAVAPFDRGELGDPLLQPRDADSVLFAGVTSV